MIEPEECRSLVRSLEHVVRRRALFDVFMFPVAGRDGLPIRGGIGVIYTL